MLPLEHPDRIQIAFDDHRLVNNAGLLLPATLAQHVGLRELVDRHLYLGYAPGRGNPGRRRIVPPPLRSIPAWAGEPWRRAVPLFGRRSIPVQFPIWFFVILPVGHFLSAPIVDVQRKRPR